MCELVCSMSGGIEESPVIDCKSGILRQRAITPCIMSHGGLYKPLWESTSITSIIVSGFPRFADGPCQSVSYIRGRVHG